MDEKIDVKETREKDKCGTPTAHRLSGLCYREPLVRGAVATEGADSASLLSWLAETVPFFVCRAVRRPDSLTVAVR
jgi:hypothetical protein